jgi:hypothetical protein
MGETAMGWEFWNMSLEDALCSGRETVRGVTWRLQRRMVSLSDVDGRALMVVEGVTDEGRFAERMVFPLEMSIRDTAKVVEMIRAD